MYGRTKFQNMQFPPAEYKYLIIISVLYSFLSITYSSLRFVFYDNETGSKQRAKKLSCIVSPLDSCKIDG